MEKVNSILEGLNNSRNSINEETKEEAEARFAKYYNEKLGKYDKNIVYVKRLPSDSFNGGDYLLKDKKSGKEFKYHSGATGYVSSISLMGNGKNDYYHALNSPLDAERQIVEYIQGIRSIETLTKKFESINKTLPKLYKDYMAFKNLNGEKIFIKNDSQRALMNALDTLFRSVKV